jgi:hypothetical protein
VQTPGYNNHSANSLNHSTCLGYSSVVRGFLRANRDAVAAWAVLALLSAAGAYGIWHSIRAAEFTAYRAQS